MPNRILKESICTSASIDALSPFQEIFYYRLIVNVDDYGRMDARIPILRSRLFPLKQIEDAEICAALAALRVQELLQVYQVNKGIYLQLCNWERHQMVRAKKSKCPAPDGNWLTLENICKQMQADDLCKQTKTNDFKCEQAQANVPVIQSNTIQYNTIRILFEREKRARARAREKGIRLV